LGRCKRIGVHATGENLAGRRNDGVVGATEASDGVEQDHHVAPVLHQPLGLLDHHLGDLATWRVAGSSKVDDTTSPLYRALHVGDFFRSLVDQEDDQGSIPGGSP
jgi:hypothetical protein